MIVLAIDTTSAQGGVAIYRDAACLAEVLNTQPANRYSVTLFEMAEAALAEAKLSFADIELYGAANGPGSFTGIRVGLAAAQGWSSAFRRPARGVSVLEAMVETAKPDTPLAIPILDARRGEFYLSVFRREADASGRRDFNAGDRGWVLEPRAISLLLGKMPLDEARSLAWIAHPSDEATPALRGSLSLPGQWLTISRSLLGAIARLARRAHENRTADASRPLDAVYIRRPDAELNWRG
jgi:tRNA threonylcarbamoyl adenosine modification protein YeaZ